MSLVIRANSLIVCSCFIFGFGSGQRTFAAETALTAVSIPQITGKTTEDSSNAYVQIQEQLYATQLAIESNRLEAATEAKRNSEEMAVRIQLLEQTILAQRAHEAEATQKSQRFTLILAGTFGMVGLAAMLLMAFLQWRAVTRLVELSMIHPRTLALGSGHLPPMLRAGEEPGAPGRAVVQLSNARLLNVVESLEKRLFDLEKTPPVPLEEFAPSAVHEQNGAIPVLSDRDECIANLLAEGQLLLDKNELKNALECFDQVLALQPKHTGTLIKKGGVLEKLNRVDEAVTCYDRAIEVDNSMTIAYLHKGGLFNRMSRYEEALQCYEHALHAHQKKTPDEKIAA
jgi:tetratricopeptide (TPR) repeat protein